MFNQYPYLNLNDLNLDYILKAIKEMRYEVTNFVSINAIKYADPIQWNITSQYEKNTIVIDPVTGTAYISVAPVPAGVALTRPEYWTVVFDLGSFVTRAAQNFTSRWESDTTTTATFPTNTGEWLVWGDVLYKAKTNIIAGDTYVVDSNIEHFTMEDLYNAYLNTIASILAMVGDLADLTTSDTTSIVNAINSVVSDFNTKIGDLNDLNTVDKTNVVNSINEVLGNINQEITDRINADNAILAVIDRYRVFNVMEYGAHGDGVTSDVSAINAAITAMSAGDYLYFPNGTYLIDSTITVTKSVHMILNCTLKITSSLAAFYYNANNLSIEGTANIVCDGGDRFILVPNDHSNFDINLNATYSGFVANAAYTFVKSNSITLRGVTKTHDSMIILTNGCTFVDISGIIAVYTSDIPLGTIVCTDSDTTHTYSKINIHDNIINGGGVVSNGLVSVTRSEQSLGVSGDNYLPIFDVNISNNFIADSAGVTDGIDVLFCNSVVISNNVVRTCFEGIAILAKVVTVSNNVVTNCRSCGIALGDLSIGSNGTSWTAIVIDNCTLINNGNSSDPYVLPAAIASDQPATCYVASVYISNCLCVGSPYGLYFGNNTGGSNIYVHDCMLTGSNGPFRYMSGTRSQFRLTNNVGYNAIGFLTPPTISTTNVTNDYEVDVMVSIINPTTTQLLYVNDVALTSIPAGSSFTYYLPKGAKTRLGTSVTGCSWAWFGL